MALFCFNRLTRVLSKNYLTRFRKRNKKHDILVAPRSLSFSGKMADGKREKKSVDEGQKNQSRGPGYESTEAATNSGKPSAARRRRDSHNDCGRSEGSATEKGNVEGTVSAESEAAQTLEEKRLWSVYSGHYDRPTSIRATETQNPVFLKTVDVFPAKAKNKKPSSSAGRAQEAAAPSRRINAKAKQHIDGSRYSKANLPNDFDHSKAAEEPSYMPMQDKLGKDVTVLDNVLYAKCGDLASNTFV